MSNADQHFEEYVQTLIAKNPSIREIGEQLAKALDGDKFNSINPLLLGLAKRMTDLGELVVKLGDALDKLKDQFDYNGGGDSWERECWKAANGEEEVSEAQAAYQAYLQEQN